MQKTLLFYCCCFGISLIHPRDTSQTQNNRKQPRISSSPMHSSPHKVMVRDSVQAANTHAAEVTISGLCAECQSVLDNEVRRGRSSLSIALRLMTWIFFFLFWTITSRNRCEETCVKKGRVDRTQNSKILWDELIIKGSMNHAT